MDEAFNKALDELRRALLVGGDKDVDGVIHQFEVAVENRLINQLMMSGALSDTR